jgi:hypothetical protein
MDAVEYDRERRTTEEERAMNIRDAETHRIIRPATPDEIAFWEGVREVFGVIDGRRFGTGCDLVYLA